MNIRRFTVNELVTDIKQAEKQIEELESLDLTKLAEGEFSTLETDVKHNFLQVRALERNKRFHNGAIEQSVLTELLSRYRSFLAKIDDTDSEDSTSNMYDKADAKTITKTQFHNFQKVMGTVGVTVLESCFSPEREHHLENIHTDFPDKVYSMLKESTDVILLLAVLNENQDKFKDLSYVQTDILTQYLTKLVSKNTTKVINMASDCLDKLNQRLSLLKKESLDNLSEDIQEFEASFTGYIL